MIVFSKISRTLISSPLSLGQDSHDTTFEAASFFRKTPDTAAWFVADVLFREDTENINDIFWNGEMGRGGYKRKLIIFK